MSRTVSPFQFDDLHAPLNEPADTDAPDTVQRDLEMARREGKAEAIQSLLAIEAQTQSTHLEEIASAILKLTEEKDTLLNAVRESVANQLSEPLKEIAIATSTLDFCESVMALIDDVLDKSQAEFKARLIVPSSTPSLIVERIDARLKERHADKKVEIILAAAEHDGDIRLEWSDGGIEKLTAKLIEDVNELFQSIVSQNGESR